jgi:nucleoside-diphosphate-sugar epimerase
VIVLAGATGNLGGRIARALIERGAAVRAIVRRGGAAARVAALRGQGVEIAEADYGSDSELRKACAGGACVVSALSGLRDVVVDAQAALLGAAIGAGVPRFIPSDFAIDFTKLSDGGNRNLDLRRDFLSRLDRAPIAATSVLNGMFTDMLTGQAPIVLFKFRRVLYWESADQPLDFTSMDDTAAFTAAAALDPSTPRFLRIAGDRVSARGLAAVASDVTGERFHPLRAGGIGRLKRIIKVARTLAPQRDAVYPPWQGMQYLKDMFEGRALLAPLDNDRYPGIRWTTARDVLAAHAASPSPEFREPAAAHG